MNKITDKKIFIVEDDADFLKNLLDYFSNDNLIKYADTFTRAKELIPTFDPDIILLDVLLPDGNGLDLIPLFKAEVPIIILSDLGSEENILNGFNEGASDYMVKPYSLKVLEQRMALRIRPHDQAFISINGMSLDTKSRTVSYMGKPIILTKSEFDLLFFLMSNAGTFYTSSEIYEHIWNMESLNTGTIRYHIHNLREKMRDADEKCEALIITKFGGGYSFRRE